MVADNPRDTQSGRLTRAFATKGELADYLESQADSLVELLGDDSYAREQIWEIAARFAEIARAHELEFVAERFDDFKPPAATGTNGD